MIGLGLLAVLEFVHFGYNLILLDLFLSSLSAPFLSILAILLVVFGKIGAISTKFWRE